MLMLVPREELPYSSCLRRREGHLFFPEPGGLPDEDTTPNLPNRRTHPCFSRDLGM